MKGERFIVVESSGYPIYPGRQQGGGSAVQTEVMVLDRAYCHKVVWSSVSTLQGRSHRSLTTGRLKRWLATSYAWPIEKRRSYAADLAARLNAQ